MYATLAVEDVESQSHEGKYVENNDENKALKNDATATLVVETSEINDTSRDIEMTSLSNNLTHNQQEQGVNSADEKNSEHRPHHRGSNSTSPAPPQRGGITGAIRRLSYGARGMSFHSQPSYHTDQSFQRRYSSPELPDDEEIRGIATEIYAHWDSKVAGVITVNDMQLNKQKLDHKFIEAIGRVLGNDDEGHILLENLVECLMVLKMGDLQSKVKLLIRFMDHDNNNTVSYEEISQYLRVSDKKMLAKLGFSENVAGEVVYKPLTFDDILSLFKTSNRGNDAINIFCQQILRLITNTVPHHQPFLLNNVRTPAPMRDRGVSMHIRRNSITEITSQVNHSLYDLLVTHNPVLLKAKLLSQTDIFKIVFVLLQVFLYIWNFFYYYNRDFPVAFCIAKGFGLNLRILSIFVYLTMARTTMGFLYSLKTIRALVPLGINIDVHSFIGYSIFVHMFGHTFGHIAYQTIYLADSGGFQNAFTQNSLLRGSNWEQKLNGDGKTGFILLLFVLLMGLTAMLRSLSANKYRMFAVMHFLYLLYLPMLFLHVPKHWPFFVSIGALMLLERAYDFLQHTTYSTLAQSRPCANGVTFLSVPRHGKTTYPGSYYRIKVPAISVHEWHPFSLAGSTSSHHLSFFIASAGDWTRRLHELVSDANKRSSTLVIVQGPFKAPASQALVRRPNAKILCVASGIGITPFFSVMATKVTDEVNYLNDTQIYRSLFDETEVSTRQMKDQQHQTLMNVLAQQWKTNNTSSDSSSGSSSGNGSVCQVIPEMNIPIVSPGVGGGGPAVSLELDDVAGLRVVWTIRDLSELVFYLDYVHHLVKSQTTFMQDSEAAADGQQSDSESDDEERQQRGPVTLEQRQQRQLQQREKTLRKSVTGSAGAGSATRLSSSKQVKLQKPVVEVDIYMTGLGSNSDPVFMLSQTLFLLSVVNKSETYMRIHFGRPNLSQLMDSIKPEEVYYCGGSALKNTLQDLCNQSHTPFHPEDFDAGGGLAVRCFNQLLASFHALCGAADSDDKPANTNTNKNSVRINK